MVVGQATSIEWTDFSSNPLRYRDAAGKVVWACAKVSAGCAHCYSEAIAHRYRKGGPFSLAQVKKVTPFIDEKECRRLLTSRKLSGKRVFIGDMTDIFGEWVPFEMLDRLFAVFALRHDVTFQILTKRPERMSEYLRIVATGTDSGGMAVRAKQHEHGPIFYMPSPLLRASLMTGGDYEPNPIDEWPLPNVWLGTSCEDQATADARIPHLLRCPAAVRFISAEPLLGPVDLYATAAVHHGRDHSDEGWSDLRGIDWVIVGGESGPGARPCDIDWIRSLIAQCRAAGVPCFVKQLGSSPFDSSVPIVTNRVRGGRLIALTTNTIKLTDRKGGDPDEWPADLRVREFPDNPRSVTGGYVSKT